LDGLFLVTSLIKVELSRDSIHIVILHTPLLASTAYEQATTGRHEAWVACDKHAYISAATMS